ncbi:hypothetical protein [Allohahella marinimesophila]
MPLFSTGDLGKSIEIYAGALGLNGIGNIDNYLYYTSATSFAFVFIALGWIVVAGVINRRFYSLKPEMYFMKHVGGAQAVLLWVAFGLSVTKLAASSFSPFLYFQF